MSQLKQNTADLDALIAKANALPDAGGGGSLETQRITLITQGKVPLMASPYIMYASSSGKFEMIVFMEAGSTYQLDCIANGFILFLFDADSEISIQDNTGTYLVLDDQNGGRVFEYYGDATIIVTFNGQ